MKVSNIWSRFQMTREGKYNGPLPDNVSLYECLLNKSIVTWNESFLGIHSGSSKVCLRSGKTRKVQHPFRGWTSGYLNSLQITLDTVSFLVEITIEVHYKNSGHFSGLGEGVWTNERSDTARRFRWKRKVKSSSTRLEIPPLVRFLKSLSIICHLRYM